MGAFAQALSSLGGAGNDLSSARQANSTQAFTDQLNALKLRQLQQALGKPDPNDPVSAISLVEKALGRPLTDDEKRMYLGLAPKVAATPAPQRPFNVAPGDAVYDPVTGTVKYTNPAKAASAKQEKPDYATFGGYDWQYDPDRKITGPRDPTGQYVRLGVSKLPKAGDDLGGSDLDALARAAAQGRNLPITKEGAALATRMQTLGLNAPLKKDIPADVKEFLAHPPPTTPTAQDSQRLAAAADRVFGGTTYRQDLMGRGRQGTLMGLRAPYAPQAYSAEEYNAILGYIKDAAAQTDGGSSSADDEINQIMNALGKGGH